MSTRRKDAMPWGFAVLAVAAVTACTGLLALVVAGSRDRTWVGSAPIAAAPAASPAPGPARPTTAEDQAPAARRPSGGEQAPVAADLDSEPLLARPARPGTESSFRELFLERARRDPAAFRRDLQGVLGGAGPLAEKVAAMRVCWEVGEPARAEAWHRALGGGIDPELRSFAVAFLVRKAHIERAARGVLVELLAARPDDVRERCEALCAVLRHGTGPEVMRCATFLDTETDAGVLAGAAEALADNGTSAARWLLSELRPAAREEDSRPR